MERRNHLVDSGTDMTFDKSADETISTMRVPNSNVESARKSTL
jgi:hypothetical protein